MNSAYILKGCGGHARSIVDAILTDNPFADILFVDNNAGEGETILGFPAVREMPLDAAVFVPASGDNLRRKSECEGKKIRSYISRTAHIGKFAHIGDGCFVAMGVHIGPEVVIGRGTIANTNAVIEHNVTVGDFSHIAPNATVCGMCHIGSLVLIGAGAVVKPCISICDGVIVGSGAVVVKDIVEPGTYVGTPARKMVKP